MRELDSEAAGRGRSFLLLPSKITCPAPEPDAIERPRVREKLAQAIARPVTTLVAPAGFGKTTALAAWADRLDGPVAWCALEEDDSDPSRFWHALACALARADERLGAPRNMAEVAWTEAVEAREALTELLAQLGAFPDTAVLVVEDLHVVQDAPVVGDTLAYFLRNLPPQVHLVLTSRTPLKVPLAKLRVRGALVEIGQDDLRLSPEEQAALFRGAALALTSEDEALLEEATQGWPAGCRLLEMRCRNAGAVEVTAIMRQARASVSDYLLEEVLEGVPADLMRFMTETAIVESFSAPLGARITGLTEAEVRSRVDRLADAGLFVQRLEGEGRATWYRYHAMLQDLLHTRLRRMPEQESLALAGRARGWLLDEGFDDAAVGLSFWMRDYGAICDIIEQRWKSLWMNDELEALLRWIDLLPAPLLNERPFLCAVAALPAAYAGDGLRGHALIQKALLRLDDGEDFLFSFCMVQKAFLASFEGKQAESAQFAEKALRFLPEEEGFLRGMMMQVRASTLWASDPLGAIAGYGEALPVQRAVGNANLLASALCNLAVFQAAVGQVADAERAAREALDLYEPGQRAAKPMLGFAWRALAEVAYERGDEVSFAESCGWFEELSVHGVVAARRAELLVLQAKDAYGRGNGASGRTAFTGALAVEEAAALSMMPTLAMIRDWRGSRNGESAGEMRGTGSAGRLGLFRLMERLVHGEDVAAESEAFADGVNSEDAALKVRACVTAAVAAERAGRFQGAVALVRQAFAVSRSWGLAAAFAENAPDMQPLAALLRVEAAKGERDGAGSGQAADDREAARMIEEALKGAPRASDALTERELDVLRVVADGASVAEAAEMLVVSRETVKKHLGNIYAKLGVHSKMQAVALLREEGVL